MKKLMLRLRPGINIFVIIFLAVLCFVLFKAATKKAILPNLAVKMGHGGADFKIIQFFKNQLPVFKPESDSDKITKSGKNFAGRALVIDGDSIKVDGKEVRLLGLDAPEYNQTCFDEKNKEYICGQVSRDFLVSLIAKKQVRCFYDEKDRYGRFLAECFVGQILINEKLVEKGMAVIYDFAQSTAKMNFLEMQAKESKAGIWKGAFELPKNYRKSHPRK
jgi:endonuclease YncB( thermonuclease family)